MKKSIWVIIFSACFVGGFVSVAIGGFTIPEDAYRMSEIDDALQEAKSEGWAVSFVLAHEKTSCPIGTKASTDAITKLEEESIIVYVNAFNNEIAKCPKIIRKAFESKKAGRTLPISVIADSEIKKIIDIVPYHDDNEKYLDNLRKARKKITEPPSLFQKVINFF